MSRVSELELCNLAYGGHDAVLKLRIAGMSRNQNVCDKKNKKSNLIIKKNLFFFLFGRHG